MRKILFAAFVGLISIGLVSGVAQAKITGVCSDCHTMHYSQTPWPDEWRGTGGPFPLLLARGAGEGVLGCLGCHIGANDGVTGYPYVYDLTQSDLAGGNFWYVGSAGGNDPTKGHNVLEFTDINVDPHLGYEPPANTDPDINWGPDNPLTCSGTYGCHGDRTKLDPFEAIKGGHHDNYTKCDDVSYTTGHPIGGSYRFLKGVFGLEKDDWERVVTPVNHNVYKGTEGYQGGARDPGTGGSISGLCGECHGSSDGGTGAFHSETGTGGPTSPWSRHPTDITLLDKGGEYEDYNNTTPGGGAGPYNPVAPLSSITVPDQPDANVVPGNDIVMCISCHRAHGTNYPDILRWAYDDTMTIGDGSCLTCHTRKKIVE